MKTVSMLVALTAVVFAPISSAADPAPSGEVSLRDLPGIHRGGDYKVDPYLKVAEALQAAGHQRAEATLEKLCDQANKEYGDGDQVIVLCRMLYVAKPNGEFRRPGLGGPLFIGTASKDWDLLDKLWKLEPIEVVDGVPFLVAGGYLLAGAPERPKAYLAYCRENCDWQAKKFVAKTPTEKQAALAKLLASPKLMQPLSDTEKEFLSSQIK